MLFLLLLPFIIKGQQRYVVLSYGLEQGKIKSYVFEKNKAYDSITILNKSLVQVSQLRSMGYAFSNLDSIRFTKEYCKLYFHLGNRMKLNMVKPDDDTKYLLEVSGANIKDSYLPDSLKLKSQTETVLNYLNNIGHPFASVQFQDIKIKEEVVDASLKINRGKYIAFDSLNIIGRYNLNKKYLENYLEIKPGKPYEHTKVIAMSKRLNDIPFLSMDSLPTVSFVNEKAIVNLVLKNRTASRFDFIFGVLPTTELGAKKYKLNFDLNAELNNKLGQGENISLKFQQLKSNDLNILVAANYPYFLGSQFGFDGSFELQQNRNLSTDASGLLGVQYIFSGNNILKLSWNNKSSNLINIDINAIKNTGKLPAQLDYKYNGALVSLLYRKLDYRFNPRKGFEVNSRVNLGLRKVVKNFQITEIKSDIVDFSKAYDSLALAKFQATINLELNKYFPVQNWATLRTAFLSGVRYTDGNTLSNEAYRIGGNKLMRGFDELSIIADRYFLFTSEFRIILEKNSFLSLPFIDLGRSRILKDGLASWRTTIGVGMGFNFSTRAGIFNFSFAAGNNLAEKKFSSPDFGNTKIHFGYLNLF